MKLCVPLLHYPFKLVELNIELEEIIMTVFLHNIYFSYVLRALWIWRFINHMN